MAGVLTPASASTSTADGFVVDAQRVTVTPAGQIAATNVQAALEELDAEKAPTGNLEVPVSSADVVLTAAQFANNSFDITGTLTASINVIIPDGIAHSFIIDNATSGAFTVTVKHAATAGIAVTQGTRTFLYTNGTTVEGVDYVERTSATGSGVLPAGTTGERDGSPANGYTRINTSEGTLEFYNASAWNQLVAAGIFKSVQVFTASGTWNRPAGVKKVLVEVQGAGGAGGGVVGTGTGNAGGAGGGGGGYARKLIDVSAIATSTITVGAGGTGVSGAAGNAGGDSSWADGTNTVTGSGGSGGGGATSSASNTLGSDTSGGAGGTGTGGDINVTGGYGDAYNTDNTFNRAHSGAGAHAFLGKGGRVAIVNAGTSAGNSGYSYGGGGSGAANEATASNGAGGAGADGVVIVYEFA